MVKCVQVGALCQVFNFEIHEGITEGPLLKANMKVSFQLGTAVRYWTEDPWLNPGPCSLFT